MQVVRCALVIHIHHVRIHRAASVICVLGGSDVDDFGDIHVFGVVVVLRFRSGDLDVGSALGGSVNAEHHE
ncbi:hypothetical protein D3C81_2280470 [compost metagenome]